jgi:hypothetical protein
LPKGKAKGAAVAAPVFLGDIPKCTEAHPQTSPNPLMACAGCEIRQLRSEYAAAHSDRERLRWQVAGLEGLLDAVARRLQDLCQDKQPVDPLALWRFVRGVRGQG